MKTCRVYRHELASGHYLAFEQTEDVMCFNHRLCWQWVAGVIAVWLLAGPVHAQSSTATLDPGATDSKLAHAVGQRGARIAPLLRSLGFNQADQRQLADAAVVSATRLRHNMDADPAEESVVDVVLKGDFLDSSAAGSTAFAHMLAWLDPGTGGERARGHLRIDVFEDSAWSTTFQKVHTDAIDDLVIRWKGDSHGAQWMVSRNGLVVITLEPTAAVLSDFRNAYMQGRYVDADSQHDLEARLAGTMPRTVEIVNVSDGSVQKTLSYSASGRKYQ